MSPPLSRSTAWWLLLALSIPTAILFVVQLGAPVDVENNALKAPGSREELALRRRVGSFGRDVVVMAAFQALPVGSGTVTEIERNDLAELARQVRAAPGVGSLQEWPGADARSVVWAIGLDVPSSAWAPTVAAVEQLVRAGAPATTRVAVSGQPIGELVVAHEVQHEQRRILPLVVAAFIVLLFLYYRHAGLVLAILGPPAMAIVWTSGIHTLLGRELDPVAVMLQPVLLTVGVAAGVHWVEHYLDRRHDGLDPAQAARSALEQIRKPAMLAALTTVVGFLSLAFNSIPAVIDFGVFAALGIALTYALASVATPALLGLFATRVGDRLIQRHGQATGSIARRAADVLARHSLAIRIAAVVVAALGVAAWSRIRVDNDPLRVLDEGHPFRRDTAVLVSEIGGSDSFEVLVPAGCALAEPVGLGLLASFALAQPGVAGPAGPALRSDDGSWLARFLLAPGGSTAREKLFAEVESRAVALGAPEVRVTGAAVQVARDSGRLIRSVLRGSFASLAILFVLFWAAFRSAYYAWLAMIPNVLPCIVVYAALALAGRPLSFATAMISSVMLGLIVDDTIHLLHRFQELRASGLPALVALERVFEQSGRAVVITSVVLAVGFSVGLSGQLTTTVEFCGFAAATIVIAFLSDAILLPALLVAPARKEAEHARA